MAQPLPHWSLSEWSQPEWSLFDEPESFEADARSRSGRTPAGAAQPHRSVTFLHTADWQLGMTRRYLTADAAHAYTAARLDAIDAIGELAGATAAEFVVVCGDVFEDHRVSARLISQALDRLRAFAIPVYLLPGNHDPYDAAGVYRSETFTARCPANVHVLHAPGTVRVSDDVDLIVAPWFHKAPVEDLVGAQLRRLAPSDRIRVVVGHGGVDTISPGTEPSVVSVAPIEQALTDGIVDYVALGDRHSVTQVGDTGRIWYAGAHEVTNFDNIEERPGHVLQVHLERGTADPRVEVTPHRVGRWSFTTISHDVNCANDIDALAWRLEAIPDKSRVVLQLGLVGTLTLADHSALTTLLDETADRFAAVRRWENHDDVVVLAESDDIDGLGLSGYAAAAAEELLAIGNGEDPDAAAAARGALALLARLSARQPAAGASE